MTNDPMIGILVSWFVSWNIVKMKENKTRIQFFFCINGVNGKQLRKEVSILSKPNVIIEYIDECLQKLKEVEEEKCRNILNINFITIVIYIFV